jgi:N-acetylneuraminic acid mutarotase
LFFFASSKLGRFAKSRFLYCLPETSQWSRQKLSKGETVPLSAHSANLIGNSLYIFGGRTNDSFSNEMFRIDTHNQSWEKIEVKGPRPSQRSGHSMIHRLSAPNELWMFGGAAANSVFNELWTFDNRMWSDPSYCETCV